MQRRRPPVRGVPRLLGLLALIAACGEAEPARPNVVLISLDTCRRDRLGCYGYERPTSPRIDELAADAMVFDDCLAQSTATAPSHTSMLTGQYPQRHGLRANGQISFPHTTLAEELREAGWSTGGFTGHGSFQAIFGHSVGFETFQSWPGEEHRDRPFTHRTRLLADVLPYALDWLDGTLEERPDRPFFLLVHGYDPHCPYDPPPAYAQELVSPYEGHLELARQCGMAGFQDVVAQEGWGDSPDGRHLSEVYDAEIRMADDSIGRFLDALRERGVYEDSIVVFTSDHGELLGEHGWVGHTRVFEPEIQVPLLVRFPGDEPRGRYPAPVEHVDLMPTILGWLGLQRPDGVQGVDHSAHLRRGLVPPAVERMRLTQMGSLDVVRFDERYKAVFGEDPRGEFPQGALFDLQADPGETRNLVTTREGRRRFDDMLGRFEAWVARNEREDALFTGTSSELTAEQEEALEGMLEALGYTGEGG